MKYIKKETKKEKKLQKGIEMQIYVTTEVSSEKWVELLDYYRRSDNRGELSYSQFGVLESMVDMKLRPPSEKQAKILYEIYVKAESIGVIA